MIIKNLVQEEITEIRDEVDEVNKEKNIVEKKNISIDCVKFNREGLPPVYGVFIREDNQASMKNIDHKIHEYVRSEIVGTQIHPTQITMFVVAQNEKVNQAHFGMPIQGQGSWARLDDTQATIGDLEQAIAKGLTSQHVQKKVHNLEKEDIANAQSIRDEFKKKYGLS